MNRTTRRYPEPLIARAKAAMFAGVLAKTVAYHTGIPLGTLKRWRAGHQFDHVKPDAAFAEAFVALFKQGGTS